MKYPKKHTISISLISLLLIFSLLPLTAAAETCLFQDIFNNKNSTFGDSANIESSLPFQIFPNSDKTGLVINMKDYSRLIQFNGKLYELMGIGSFNSDANTPICNGKKQFVIPPLAADATEAEKELWSTQYGDLSLAYAPHSHQLEAEPWQADKNNHWKWCPVCGSMELRNWHQDLNHDGICDDCNYKIHYYTVTVKPTTGGKIVVSADQAELNQTIHVTVSPDAGYHLKEIHGYNLNDMHSELVRWEDVKGQEYHFVVLPWDIEIEAVFEKD